MAKGTQNQRKRVSDIISVSDLESWTTDNIIIIKAGTGANPTLLRTYYMRMPVRKRKNTALNTSLKLYRPIPHGNRSR